MVCFIKVYIKYVTSQYKIFKVLESTVAKIDGETKLKISRKYLQEITLSNSGALIMTKTIFTIYESHHLLITTIRNQRKKNNKTLEIYQRTSSRRSL